MKYEHEDYCHCFDYRSDCPSECFRAKLTKEYKKYEDNFFGIPISWAHFGNDDEMCKKRKKNENND